MVEMACKKKKPLPDLVCKYIGLQICHLTFLSSPDFEDKDTVQLLSANRSEETALLILSH